MSDIKFFLLRMETHGGHTVGCHDKAIMSLRTRKEMKQFLKGHIEWYIQGDNNHTEAELKAKANIGHAIYYNDRPYNWLTSLWIKLLWLTLGVTRSKISFA